MGHVCEPMMLPENLGGQMSPRLLRLRPLLCSVYASVASPFHPFIASNKFLHLLIRIVSVAPEKVSGENVGVAADIWGVGVLAFILLVLFFFLILSTVDCLRLICN